MYSGVTIYRSPGFIIQLHFRTRRAPLSLGEFLICLLNIFLRNNNLRYFTPQLGMLHTINTINMLGNLSKGNTSCSGRQDMWCHMDKTKKEALQHRIQELYFYLISLPYVELEGRKKNVGIDQQDVTNNIKDSGLSSSSGADIIKNLPLTSSLSEELNKQNYYLTVQLNNEYLSQTKKYATKILLKFRRPS